MFGPRPGSELLETRTTPASPLPTPVDPCGKKFVMPAQAWVTLVVGVLATLGVVGTLLQRNRSENRDAWWSRFEWALESTYSENASRRQDGWRVLGVLAESTLATRTEEDLILSLCAHLLGTEDSQAASHLTTVTDDGT